MCHNRLLYMGSFAEHHLSCTVKSLWVPTTKKLKPNITSTTFWKNPEFGNGKTFWNLLSNWVWVPIPQIQQTIMSPNPECQFGRITIYQEAIIFFGLATFRSQSQSTKIIWATCGTSPEIIPCGSIGQPRWRSLIGSHLIAGNARPRASYGKIQVTARRAVFTCGSTFFMCTSQFFLLLKIAIEKQIHIHWNPS